MYSIVLGVLIITWFNRSNDFLIPWYFMTMFEIVDIAYIHSRLQFFSGNIDYGNFWCLLQETITLEWKTEIDFFWFMTLDINLWISPKESISNCLKEQIWYIWTLNWVSLSYLNKPSGNCWYILSFGKLQRLLSQKKLVIFIASFFEFLKIICFVFLE